PFLSAVTALTWLCPLLPFFSFIFTYSTLRNQLAAVHRVFAFSIEFSFGGCGSGSVGSVGSGWGQVGVVCEVSAVVVYGGVVGLDGGG
ncbi:hypothetical protein ACTHTR_10805, partial [Neisseria sp. P0018.S004]|uniref:hypothetical protein n=1 Tax=Neisseria sp. P0018.S004 TaxID=3436790 RepID=UPI003F7FCDA7